MDEDANLRVAWTNKGNYCHMNSLVSALQWTVMQSGVPAGEWGHTPRVKPGTQSLKQLLGVHLLGWRQVDSQHDVVEFMSHLLPRIRVSQHLAVWQTRQQQCHMGRQRVTVQDTSSRCQPIRLLDSESANLQQAVNHWHDQPAIHALQGPAEGYRRVRRIGESKTLWTFRYLQGRTLCKWNGKRTELLQLLSMSFLCPHQDIIVPSYAV